MRVKTIQIVWHEKKPVYSVDFHSSGVLATGGGDKDVKVWPRSGFASALQVALKFLLVFRQTSFLVLQLWEVSETVSIVRGNNACNFIHKRQMPNMCKLGRSNSTVSKILS